jgi:hypothetical protein
MRTMHILLATAPFILAIGACRDYGRDRSGEPLSHSGDVTAEERARAAETMDNDTVPDDRLGAPAPMRDRGDSARGGDIDQDAIVIPEESARVGLSDQQVVERFRADIQADPVLSKEKARLVLENGRLILRGSVSSKDVGDGLVDYAEKLADGREVVNELKVPMENE